MQKADFILLLVSVTLCLVLSEFAARYVVDYYIHDKKRYMNDEAFAFYQKYYPIMHHLREIDLSAWDFNKNPKLFIYTEITPFKEGGKNILLQGDSWMQQVELSPKSMDIIRSTAEKNGWGFLNGGTSSYAPSPMALQLRTIRELGLSPNYIIGSIEQSDFGDELCRYEKRKVRDENGRLLRVEPEPLESKEVYAMAYFFKRQHILRREGSALHKLVDNVISRAHKELTEQKRHCNWPEIAKPLTDGLTGEEKEIVTRAVNDYLDEVFSTGEVERLLLVVHPHKRHFPGSENPYKFYIYDTIKEIVAAHPQHEKIKIVNFMDGFDTIYEGRASDDIFQNGDAASHLNGTAHAIYITHILKKFSEL